MIEITKCTLRCIFCHRLKTYRNGDTRASARGRARRLTRRSMKEYLELKLEKLSLQNGECCAGHGKGQCLFTKAINDIKAKRSAREMGCDLVEGWVLLIMMMYDFDHDDRLEKVDSVYNLFFWNKL